MTYESYASGKLLTLLEEELSLKLTVRGSSGVLSVADLMFFASAQVL